MMYLYIRLHRAKNKPMQEFKALRLKIHIYRHTYKGTKTNDGRHQSYSNKLDGSGSAVVAVNKVQKFNSCNA